MLERNSVNVYSNTRHSSHYKSENRMAVSVILVQFVLWNTAFCPRTAGMMKTVPHTTVSPQMWCISGYTHPDLLARFGKVNLLDAKKLAWFFFSTN